MCQMGEGNQGPQVITIPKKTQFSEPEAKLGEGLGCAYLDRTAACIWGWKRRGDHSRFLSTSQEVKSSKSAINPYTTTVHSTVLQSFCHVLDTVLDISGTNMNMKYILPSRSSRSGRKYNMQTDNDHLLWKVHNMWQRSLPGWFNPMGSEWHSVKCIAM